MRAVIRWWWLDRGDAMRVVIVFVGTLLVLVASCSGGESMPESFNGMAPDEVGCTVKYGDVSPHVVGPLGPSDSENVEPNDYTFIRLGRTASSIVVVTEFPDSGSNGEMPLNKITTDGVVVRRGSFRNSGEPGYVVTCWRGDG